MIKWAENVKAVLHYEKPEYFPICLFGYWHETLQKWADEGHIRPDAARDYIEHGDCCAGDLEIMAKLGFDIEWGFSYAANMGLTPPFEHEVLSTEPDGAQIIRNADGLIEKIVPGIVSIPAEVGTTLTDREAWEKYYVEKLVASPSRVDVEAAKAQRAYADSIGQPFGVYCSSMIGFLRNLTGVVGLSYLYADDEELFAEMVHTIGEIAYVNIKTVLGHVKFDFANYWEDIACKSGPLVSPRAFEKYVVPEYERINALLHEHGIDIISLDCDGVIDRLIPGWLKSGVNTMFPIEVGTWGASIAPWREKYGKQILGVGGMNKNVFSADRAAVDKEIDRLMPLIEMGGYIPCPDHRIAPDAKFELVAYYCEQLKKRVGR